MVKRGPITSVGKAASKMNAVKSGYYAKQLLPWEDAKEIESLREALREQWASEDDPTSMELVDQLHSVQVRVRRLERLEDEYVTTRLYGQPARIELCKEAGVDPARAQDLPDWFFDDSLPGRQEARRLHEVHQELVQMEYGDTSLSHSKRRARYPKAMAEMVPVPGEVRINLERRLRREALENNHEGSSAMFLRCFEQEYVFELLWARSPARCDALVRGLRASIALRAQSQEPWGRLLVSLLKLQSGLISALASLKRQRENRLIFDHMRPLGLLNKNQSIL